MSRLTQPAFDPTMPYSNGAMNTPRSGFDSRMPYDYCVTLPASSDPVDVKYGVAEIYEWDKANQRHKIRRPESDSISCANCVILPGHTITNVANDQPITASLYPSKPIIVAYEGDEPEIGDTLGTQTDSYALKVGNTGYICMGVITHDGGASEGLCLVRPFASSIQFFEILGNINVTGSTTVSPGNSSAKFVSAWSDLSSPFDGTTNVLVDPEKSGDSGSFTSLLGNGCYRVDVGIEFGDASGTLLGSGEHMSISAAATSGVYSMSVFGSLMGSGLSFVDPAEKARGFVRVFYNFGSPASLDIAVSSTLNSTLANPLKIYKL